MTVAIGKQKEWKFKNQFRVFVHPRSGLVDDLPEDVVVASLVRKRLRPLRVRNVQVLPGKTPRSNFKWTTDIVQLLLASVISYFHQLLLSSIFTFNYFFYQLYYYVHQLTIIELLLWLVNRALTLHIVTVLLSTATNREKLNLHKMKANLKDVIDSLEHLHTD
jgi:hypothetical protein